MKKEYHANPMACLTQFYNIILKLILQIQFLITLAAARDGEAPYKIRLHKNFIKEIFDQNLPAIFQHVESYGEKNSYLMAVNANIDELR